MYENPLTKDQKAQNFSESISRSIIKALKQKKGDLDIPHQDFARSIGINPDTWKQWRKAVDPKVKNKPGVDVKMVLQAAFLANLNVKVEVTV